MGSASSKFRKLLQRGDEYAVMQLYERHVEIRKNLDPNASCGEHHSHNTPLHFAARYCMKAMIRIFLNDHGANPNKRNADEATALHLLCQIGGRARNVEAKLRADCLALFLAWEGLVLSTGEKERVNLDCLDNKKQTALHYAAQSGLKRCVEMLVCKGANLFLENENKETPCDLAVKARHQDIADYLETRMIFAQDNKEDLNEEDIFPVTERYSGLREQDLREAKDLLLVETSDMLHVPLFTAEALLKNHEWSREALLESWMRDPASVCEKCGVQPPLSLMEQRKSSTHSSPGGDVEEDESSRNHGSSQDLSSYVDHHLSIDVPLVSSASGNIECDICAGVVVSENVVSNSECDHRFCRICWKSYISVKVLDGEFQSINCPAYECSKLVPLDLIERVLSPKMTRKFLKFDIKAFVESNPRIKWCPFPGCTNAVRLPDGGDQPPVYMRAFPTLQPPPPTSSTVYCPNGHSFCWECLSDGHEPTSCDKWKEWHEKIAEVRPEELKDTTLASETAANCLWLVTHSKPCPKCKSPIQKNEGCNHMKCSKCKHDFCWVCLSPWKKHSTETGGYFRCNRYEDSRKVEEKNDQAIAEAKEQSRKAQELNRFVHYYSRYKNHLNSYELEKPLLDNMNTKIQSLSIMARRESEENIDLSFIKDAINELLRSRKVLSSSYAYGYFLKDCGYNKTIFEYLQNELEVMVETLSGLVGRSYLRGSRQRIVIITQLVANRRHRFIVCISRGLLPPETPPSSRKGRRRHLPAILGLDKDEDDWMKGGVPKVDEFDPSRPWVKDSRGRYHNLFAILDWPEEESDEEQRSGSISSATDTTSMVCEYEGCNRPKAKNPRTGSYHSHCSLKCRYLDMDENDDASTSRGSNRQYNVDLMIALQMSKLQLLQELRLLSDESTPSSPNATRTSPQNVEVFGDDVDPDLQLAIERSMLELSVRKSSDGSDVFAQEMPEECCSTTSARANVDASALSSYLKKMVDKDYLIASENLCDAKGNTKECEEAYAASVVCSSKVQKMLIRSARGGDSCDENNKQLAEQDDEQDSGVLHVVVAEQCQATSDLTTADEGECVDDIHDGELKY